MTLIAVLVFVSLTLLAAGQGIYVLVFARFLGRPDAALPADHECPKAAVILCLRGADPFLRECLTALFQMDYPNYEIRIIVDHPHDPARKVVQELRDYFSPDNLHTELLRDPSPRCSLKCSSLVQAISELDESYLLIAQLDADTIPHAGWLRELASALQRNPDAGAVTGIRWYMPDDQNWGSLIRYIWNSAAVVQMYWYRIAWGGTLAIKTDLVRDAGLLDRWSRAFCEDTMLDQQLKQHRKKLTVVPSLLMVNRESCNVSDFFHWVKRQLLTARLYHPLWGLVVFHALSTTLMNLMSIVIIVIALFQNDNTALVWAASGLVCFQIANYIWLIILEYAAGIPVKNRDASVAWMSAVKLIRLFVAVPLTQIIHCIAVVASSAIHTTQWRGITYQIHGSWQIRMVEYHPFRKQRNKTETESL